jgi:hypothetical protein
MVPFQRRRTRLLFVWLVVLAVLALSACGCNMNAQAQSHPHGMMLILVMDETASFVSHWEASVSKAAQAVAQLRPGDSFLVLGLDDHAWDEADVRLPLTVLPSGSLKAAQAKSRLIAQIRALKPRPTSSGALTARGVLRGTPKGTDTSGVIDFASRLAERAEGRAVSLAVFSDFEVEPGRSSARQQPGRFPTSSRFVALFVNSHGGSEVTRRIERWCQKMNALGAECTSSDFLLGSEVPQAKLVKR